MGTGAFITFEGGEGSGKSTLIASLKQKLISADYPVLSTFEPGSTPLGQDIRSLLLTQKKERPISPWAELLLFLADRAEHISTVILPELAKGTIVLCDRFNDSTIAYQGFARGLDVPTVANFCDLLSEELIPDLTIYLDLEPAVGLQRALQVEKKERKEGEKDRIEAEEILFHDKLRQGFRILAEANPDRIVTIDASRQKEEVLQLALHAIEKKLHICL